MKNKCIRFLLPVLFLLLSGNVTLFALGEDKLNCILIPSLPDSLESGFLPMGNAVSPSGQTIRVNGKNMLWNDRPVIPVMGEIHYARVPSSAWRNELLKMKAGGINIVSAYVFWIHHEEIKGEYDWEGQRDLHAFVALCGELGLKLILRVGPWCHGEVRNGGLPDWLVAGGMKLRNNNPAYLEAVEKWYGEIYRQVEGLLWKDGGPVIGIQIENEYRGRWEHLAELKKIAVRTGFDLPLYTRTGWPALSSPAVFGELIPLYGDYADGFWDRSLQEMPGDYPKNFLFRAFRNSTVIATEQLPPQEGSDRPEDMSYPYFTCELGGGMMTSYHRRIDIAPMDVFAMALVKVGSGSNLPGYYMYHGGTNPEGKLTTLNELQNSPMTNYNDLPVKSYDFQAPLGEFGQINPHYHKLRLLHMFLHDFGSDLAGMDAFFPEEQPAGPDDDDVLRWSARSDGRAGFVFVNNYRRLKPSSEKKNIRFKIELPGGTSAWPEKSFTVPSGSSFWLPFNIRLGMEKLVYATAQPLAKISDAGGMTFFYSKIPDVPAHFIFETAGSFMNVPAGRSPAIVFNDAAGSKIKLVLLDETDALHLWKGELAGRERIILSDADLTFDGRELQLTGRDTPEMSVSVYPAPQQVIYGRKALKENPDGIFRRYKIEMPVTPLPPVRWKQIRESGELRTIPVGIAKVAESPCDEDFQHAAVWQIVLPENTGTQRDLYLQLPYIGDVARIYSGDRLLTDNFYNGKIFELGLKTYAPDIYRDSLLVKILPLAKNAPVYFQSGLQFSWAGKMAVVSLPDVKLYEKHTAVLIVR